MAAVRRILPGKKESCDACQVDFVELEKVALANPDPIEDLPSARAELYEIMLSSYIR